MRAGVVSVGSELLLGDLVDTNAQWLSQRLTELGVEVAYHVAAPDDLDELVDVLRWLRDRCDVLVVGGGLGPTPDDLTREAVAAAAGVALEHRDDLEEVVREVFTARGMRMPASNLRQARIPAGALAIAPVGTAPGFQLELPGDGRPCVLYALPGVPWELQELFERDVAPDLLGRSGAGATITRVVHVAGMGESAVSEVLEALVARVDGNDGMRLSFLAKRHEIHVRVTVTRPDVATARAASEPVVKEVVRLVGPGAIGVDDEELEGVVVRLLCERGQTVATAESCTAGGLSARLAEVAGASDALRGGAVVYATDVKSSVLGVPEELVDAHGPVSEPVTAAMAQRAREVFGADWGVAVACVAGPGTQGRKPVGTSVWALAHPDGTVEVHQRDLPGDRISVKARLGTAALDLLRRRLVAGGGDGGFAQREP